LVAVPKVASMRQRSGSGAKPLSPVSRVETWNSTLYKPETASIVGPV